MGLPTAILAARAFIKSADTMPNWPKFFLLLAFLLTFLTGYALRQLPAILHEAPPTIRALKGQPGEPQPENHAEAPRVK